MTALHHTLHILTLAALLAGAAILITQTPAALASASTMPVQRW